MPHFTKKMTIQQTDAVGDKLFATRYRKRGIFQMNIAGKMLCWKSYGKWYDNKERKNPWNA